MEQGVAGHRPVLGSGEFLFINQVGLLPSDALNSGFSGNAQDC